MVHPVAVELFLKLL